MSEEIQEKNKDKNFIWYGHFGVDDKASPDAGEDFSLHFFIKFSISIDGTRQTLINQFKIILSAILEYEETVIGIYKNIKVKVWENEKDSSKYSLELYDYDDDSITWQELEAAGFREYSSLRWYTVVPKEDVKILK